LNNDVQFPRRVDLGKQLPENGMIFCSISTYPVNVREFPSVCLLITDSSKTHNFGKNLSAWLHNHWHRFRGPVPKYWTKKMNGMFHTHLKP